MYLHRKRQAVGRSFCVSVRQRNKTERGTRSEGLRCNHLSQQHARKTNAYRIRRWLCEVSFKYHIKYASTFQSVSRHVSRVQQPRTRKILPVITSTGNANTSVFFFAVRSVKRIQCTSHVYSHWKRMAPAATCIKDATHSLRANSN